MLRAEFKWAFALLLWGLTGCQCSMLTRHYADAIDDISDRDLELDAFYRPTWDLNRIGKPDWCQSAFNRFWCRCHGCDNCCHNPSNDDSVDDNENLDTKDRPFEEVEEIDSAVPTGPVTPPRPPEPIDARAVTPDENRDDDLSSVRHAEGAPAIVRHANTESSHKSNGDGKRRGDVFSTQTPLRVPSPNILPVS